MEIPDYQVFPLFWKNIYDVTKEYDKEYDIYIKYIIIYIHLNKCYVMLSIFYA